MKRLIKRLIFVLRRDLASQVNTSRNLKESIPLKAARWFWVCVHLIKAIRVAFRSMFREQLGSQVIFEGRRCYISNMAQSAAPTLADGKGFYRQYVPRDEITNVVNAGELMHRFEFGFSFYSGSWLGIDVNRRLYPRAYARE